jgi:hypothetical protein
MPINEGGCLCGAVRYRISGVPLFSVICHCATCRKASAAPTVAWLTFERAHFEILAGRPQPYQSSSGVTRGFCNACGSALTYEKAATPSTIDVTTLSLDDPTVFPPTAEVWLEHRVPWQASNGSLGQFLQGAEADAPAEN